MRTKLRALLLGLLAACPLAFAQISESPAPDHTYSTWYNDGYGAIYGTSKLFGLGYVSGTSKLQLMDTAGNVMESWADAGTTVTKVVNGAESVIGKLSSAATAAGGAGFILPHGTAPSSPVNGDIWTTTSGLYVRINGTTIGPLIDSGGTLTWATPGTIGSTTPNTGAFTTLSATGKITSAASAAGGAGLIAPHGTAPTSPVNGDIWTTTAGLYVRINGVTKGPLIDTAGATTWATPGTIGSTTPNTGAFTTLSATGKVTTPAAVSGSASLIIPHGTAPASPVNGDVWTTSAGLYVRINGATVGPLIDVAGSVPWATPGTIGSTTPNTGAFTTLAATTITATGKVTTPATVVGGAGLILPHGTAPTSPVDGDVWTTTAGVYVRVNGVTVGPLVSAETFATGAIAGDLIIRNAGATAWEAKSVTGDIRIASDGTVTYWEDYSLLTGTFPANKVAFGSGMVLYEGSTSGNGYLTGLGVRDPTAERQIFLPNRSGDVLLSGDTLTGDVTATMDTDGSTAVTLATVPVTKGGTGLTSATQGDILYASAANTYSALAKSATAGQFLSNSGTSNAPAWVSPKTKAIVLTAASATVPTTGEAGTPTQVESGAGDSTKPSYWYADFGDSAVDSVNPHLEWQCVLPDDYNGGTITFTPQYDPESGSGTVIFGCQAIALGDNVAMATAFGTAQTSTDTIQTTTRNHIGPVSSAITIGGSPAAGQTVFFKIYRDISDTCTATVRFLSAKIEYTPLAY